MQEYLIQEIDQAISAVQQLKQPKAVEFILKSAELLANTFKTGHKVLIAGNGGSLCDAMHFAEELTGFFREKRAALPAIALADPGHITCTGNDLGFEYIFSRLVEAHGQEGDVFIGLTTSGNSLNILQAFHQAKAQGLKTIAFLGKQGGKAAGLADLELIIQGFSTSDRIQEAHMAAIHLMIDLVEQSLFKSTKLFTQNN